MGIEIVKRKCFQPDLTECIMEEAIPQKSLNKAARENKDLSESAALLGLHRCKHKSKKDKFTRQVWLCNHIFFFFFFPHRASYSNKLPSLSRVIGSVYLPWSFQLILELEICFYNLWLLLGATFVRYLLPNLQLRFHEFVAELLRCPCSDSIIKFVQN